MRRGRHSSLTWPHWSRSRAGERMRAIRRRARAVAARRPHTSPPAAPSRASRHGPRRGRRQRAARAGAALCITRHH
eukprot:7154139-Prymnesium_polylepis.2